MKTDPTRPFCSKDITELPERYAKGTARNILSKLHKMKLTKVYCKDVFTFHILELSDPEKIRIQMSLSPMRGKGVKRLETDIGALLESLPWDELCKIHDVHLTVQVRGLYDIFKKEIKYVPDAYSKDITFGSFNWQQYRSVKVILHQTGTVSFYLSCRHCPVESSAVGFMGMAAFLGGIRNELLNVTRTLDPTLTTVSLEEVGDWQVAKWHYGRDSTQEFNGAAFNITFKMWCGALARIYLHQQNKIKKLRVEVTQTPNKPLREAVAEKLNLCCGCEKCSSR